jgi:hypothetical protein
MLLPTRRFLLVIEVPASEPGSGIGSGLELHSERNISSQARRLTMPKMLELRGGPNAFVK